MIVKRLSKKVRTWTVDISSIGRYFYINLDATFFEVNSDELFYLNESDHLEIYTGIEDSNDIEIYELDVVTMYSGNESVTGVIVFEDNNWVIKTSNGFILLANQFDYKDRRIVVVGNFHEDKSLID